MDLLLLLLLGISLYVLIKSSDFFTDAAEKIGRSFGMPPFVVGVTIVAVGTSLPELLSSIVAVLAGKGEIVIGNVIGSNIANIFLVLGVASVISVRKMKIAFELIHVDIPLLAGSAFLLALTMIDMKFTLFDAVLSLVMFVLYAYYTIKAERKNTDREIMKEMKGELKKVKATWVEWTILLVSSIFIYLGAKGTVDAVIRLSNDMGISADVIAVSIVALGTSLPELFVTISAARKGKPEMAVGNVLGSNIFNSTMVIGASGLFGQLIVTKAMLLVGMPVMLCATLLFFFITQDKEITQWEGWLLLVFYVFFIGYLFNYSTTPSLIPS